jgi:phosphoribosylglycinamide formyltransferase 1
VAPKAFFFDPAAVDGAAEPASPAADDVDSAGPAAGAAEDDLAAVGREGWVGVGVAEERGADHDVSVASRDMVLPHRTFRLVVLASGSGSNLQAILDRVHGREGIEVAGVGSDKLGARALQRARAIEVATAVFPREDFPDREARDAAIAAWIEERGADLVVLAGYMQLLSPAFVARFRGRIVNVHPALLPSFPGLDAIGQALAAGVETTGVTVHFVDEGVDTGPTILQREVPVPADGDRERLEQALHAAEHELYPEAIRMIAQGRARIDASDPRVVVIDE